VTPNDLVMKLTKNNRAQAGWPVGTFWKTWLQSDLNHRGEESDVYKKLSMLIGNDIMKVRQVTRRNILHGSLAWARLAVVFCLGWLGWTGLAQPKLFKFCAKFANTSAQ
jgi:hypothetical protein